MHILHTVLYTFPKVLTRRICLTNKSLVGDHFLYSHDLNVWFRDDIVRRNLMVATLRDQQVKCISIRAVFYDRSNILNAWMMEERKNQTNRQTKFSWIILEEARWFSTAISYVLNTMVWYWNVKYNEREWWMIPLFNLLDLFRSYIVCLFCRLFNLLGTTSSSSVETTSKYNSSAIIFKPIQGRVV